MTIAEQLTSIINSTNKLIDAVLNKDRLIDAKIQQLAEKTEQFAKSAPVQSVNGMTGNVNVRGEYPIYRLSKNQLGSIDSGFLVGFVKNSKFDINLSLYRTVSSGIEWDKRDKEEQEILTAMGLASVVHFSPNIYVIKASWSGYSVSDPARWLIWPDHLLRTTQLTTASYAKLVSGSINGYWLQDVNHEWSLCGTHVIGTAGHYIHAHPYVYSESGEVLFIWPAVVAGFVELDKKNPKWGFYPNIDPDINK